MTIAANRSSLSRRVVLAVESLKAMLWKRLFRSSISESFRPAATNRFLWLETLAGLIGIGSEDSHRGGVLRVSAKERAKRAALRAYRRRFLMAEQLEVRALMATITATYTPYGTDGNNGSLSITLPNDSIKPLTTTVSQTYVNNATTNLFQFQFLGALESYAINWTTSDRPTGYAAGFYDSRNGGYFQFKDHAVKDLQIIEAGTGTTYVDTVQLNTVPLNTAMNSSSRLGNLWNNIDITAKTITFGTDSYSSTDPKYPTNTFALASASIALKSNDGLNFTTTGVQYLGSITVNPAAATGQPYAGDQSLVGPDWGSLGYAPDNPTNYNQSSGNTTYNYVQTKIGNTTYTNQIVAVIGDTLYLKPGSVIIPTGDVQFATVQPKLSTTTLSSSDANGFIPRLSALARLSLTVTDPSQTDESITTAIQQLDSTLSLSAQTNGGNITIQDLSNATGNNVLYVNKASIKDSTTDVTGAITIAANAAIEGTYPGQLSNSARWTLKNATNYGPQIYSDGHLMITSNGQYEANAAWYNLPVNVDRNFTVSFGYSAADAVNDGATFTLHNDSRGTNALGGNAAQLGYGGTTTTNITNSVSYQLNLTTGFTRGTNFRNGGSTGGYTGGYNATGNVNIGSGQNIQVTLRYDAAAQTFTETLTDQSSPPNTYTKTYTGINIQSTVGGKTTAYMGFTGATGGGYATQSIRDFKLTYDDAGDTYGRLTATDVTLYATGTNGGIGNTEQNLDLLSSSEGHEITVTAQVNDGAIFLNQWDAGGNEGLILSKLTAAQGGSTATTQNNQVVYNSTPAESSATYVAGNHNIWIGSNGPVVVDEISATGTITLYGSSILQGDDKSPNGIATSVSLNATGTANYVGQVTYTRGTNNTSDTLNLPTNATKTWSQLGFVANQQIAITGALAITNNGFFRVKSVATSTLTLFESEIVSAETDFVTIGNGVIGLPGSQSNGQSNALQLTSVPQFSATTANGSMFLQLGGSVNSTAVSVSAGSANSMPNNVNIASDAQFLTTQSIRALSGQAALNMSSGTIFEFPGATDPTIQGQSVSLTSPYEIGTRQTPVWTGATGGLSLNMTATSRSSASAYVVNKVVPTSLSVTTYNGDVTIKSSTVAPGASGYNPAGVLSFTNNELSVTTAAATVPVNFSNTDGDHGSDGDVKVTSALTAGSLSAGISSSGTAGTGKILTTTGTIKAAGSTLNLTAASGIGSAATPVAISSPNALTLVATTNSGPINLTGDASSPNTLSLNAITSSGDISANWSGDIQLFNTISVTDVRDLILDSISATGSVNLTSSRNILNTENFGIATGNDSTITLAASQSIGTASNPMLVTTGSSLIASGPGSTANVPVTAASIYVEGSSNLTVSQAVATGTVDISATGDLSLAGDVTGGSGTSLTSETGAVQQSAGTITATNLSIQGQSIGSMKGQSFDGSTSVTIPSEASTFSDFTTGFSAGMWVYPTSFSGNSGVFALGSGGTFGTSTANDIWMKQADSTGGLDFVNTVNGANYLMHVPNALQLNQWQYLAVTISTTGTGRVYVNGNLVGSPTGVGVPRNVTRSANVIGKENYDGGGFHGQMSLFSVWDRELTQGEIQAATASLYTPYTGNQDGLLYQNSLGSISGVLQTNTPAIHAIASNGGIYLSNSNSSLNLTADAIGTDSGDTANNVTIYSAGTINLTQESNATTQLASTLPMGAFSPGGVLTLVAGRTLNRDGQTVSSGSYQTITSSATTAQGTAVLSQYGELSSITVTNQGRGYLSAPVVTFSGGGGTGATATAQLDSTGKVTTITVDTVGSGYTTVPTVILSSPGNDVYTGTFSINGYTDTTITTGPAYLQYPNLVIIDGTAEVSADTADVNVPAALITLADLTSKPVNTPSNVPVTNATVQVITESNGSRTLSISGVGDIIINTLGLSGTAGNATIPQGWNLKIQAGTGGSVVFLNQDDTITTTGTGTITITAPSATTSSLAALGHLTTAGRNIQISAGGSISVGTLNAGTAGIISVTSSLGAILFNENGRNLVASATTLSKAKSGVVLTEANRNTVTAALANLQLQAAVVLAAATAANATAVATYAASKAQVAANQALKDSLKAATDSMQGAVTAAQGDFATKNSIVSSRRDRVAKDTAALSTLAAVADNLKSVKALAELGILWAEVGAHNFSVAMAPTVQVPAGGAVSHTAQAGVHLTNAFLGLSVGTLELSSAVADGLVSQRLEETLDDLQEFVDAQGDASAAKGQLLALQNTLTALSAAYGVATTAYSKSVQESNNLFAYGQTVALTGKHNEAKAISDVLFASPSEPISASGTVTINATGSVSITPSPDTVLTVTGAPAAGAPALTLTLDAGGLPVAYTGTTFQAGSGSSAPKQVNFSNFGSITTLNGSGNFKLTGTSNSDAMALQANSQQAGTATLNGTPYSFTGMNSFQYLGAGGGDNLRVTPLPLFANQVPVPWNLAVQLDGGTGTLAHVIYDAQDPYVDVETTGTNKALIVEPGIATVGLNNVNQVTVYAQDTANVLNLPTLAFTVPTNVTYDAQAHYANPATINGGASLDGITPTFTYYRGTMVHSSRQIAAPINPGKYTVVCSWPGDDNYTPATSSQLMTISPAPASKLAFTQTPSTGTAGSVLPTLTVAIEDAYGNVVNTYTSAPTVALNSGPTGGSFNSSSTLAVDAVNGVATFSNLILNTAGTYTFRATDGSLTSATTGSIAINAAAASKLAFTQAPSTGTAGSVLSALTVAIKDSFGNIVATNNSAPTIALNSGPTGGSFTSSSTLTVAAVNGVATFSNIILNTAGTYTFYSFDGSLTAATTGSIVINAAAASAVVVVPATPTTSAVVVASAPPTGTAGRQLASFTAADGEAMSPVFTTGTAGSRLAPFAAHIVDAYGNIVTSDTSTVTIAVHSGPSSGFAPGSTHTAKAVNGVAKFDNLILHTAGTHAFRATAGSLTSAPTGNIPISPAAASKVAFTQVPTTGTAGTPLTASQLAPFAAHIIDAYGNIVTSDTSTVTIAVHSGPSSGFAPGSTITAKAENGVAKFDNLILHTAGTHAFWATAGALTSATTGNIVISAAAASKLAFTQVPTTGTAGTPLTALQVAIKDTHGNTVTSDTSTVTIAVKSGPGGFASGSTLTATAVNGVATFNNFILTTAGTYTFAATDGSLTSATTGNIVISATASKLAFTTTPSTGTAGTPLTALQVAIRDTNGNVVTSNTSAVTIAVKSGPGGFASGSTLTTTAVNGLATFSNLILSTPGTYTFTVTAGALTSATTGNIVISAAAASRLAFTTTPSTGTAGIQLSALKVAIRDTNGNVVTSNTSTVTIAVKSGPGGFTSGSTITAKAVNGVATFSNLTLNTSGTHTFMVTAGTLTSATTGNIVISAAAASKLAFTQVPTTGTAGTPLTALKVAILDIYGNLVTSNTSTVTIAVRSGPTTSLATGWTLAAKAVNGVATFSTLTLNTAGTYTFMATGGMTPATTGNVVISAAAASKLAFTQVPTTGTAGTPLTALQVAIRDTYGNLVTSDTSAVTIAVKSGPGGFTSGSTLTAKVVNGVAPFSNLMLNKSGTYTFTVTAGSLTSATTGSIVISAAAASAVVFTQTPSTASVNKLLDTMTVSIVDVYGNVTPTTRLVTLSISSGPSGGNFGLGSILNVTAVNGVAKFSNIKLAKAGKYTLKAVAGSLASATSGDIVVS